MICLAYIKNHKEKVNGKVASVSIQQCLSYYRNCHLDIGSNHHWGPANTGRSLHCPLHLDETKKTREKVSLTSQHFFLLCNYKWFLFLFRFQSPNWDRIASIINPAYAPQINEPEPVSIKIRLAFASVLLNPACGQNEDLFLTVLFSDFFTGVAIYETWEDWNSEIRANW